MSRSIIRFLPSSISIQSATCNPPPSQASQSPTIRSQASDYTAPAPSAPSTLALHCYHDAVPSQNLISMTNQLATSPPALCPWAFGNRALHVGNLHRSPSCTWPALPLAHLEAVPITAMSSHHTVPDPPPVSLTGGRPQGSWLMAHGSKAALDSGHMEPSTTTLPGSLLRGFKSSSTMMTAESSDSEWVHCCRGGDGDGLGRNLSFGLHRQLPANRYACTCAPREHGARSRLTAQVVLAVRLGVFVPPPRLRPRPRFLTHMPTPTSTVPRPQSHVRAVCRARVINPLVSLVVPESSGPLRRIRLMNERVLDAHQPRNSLPSTLWPIRQLTSPLGASTCCSGGNAV